METTIHRIGEDHRAAKDLDLWLEIFLTIRDPRHCYSSADIASATGVSRSLIWQLERSAVRKMRMELMRRAIAHGDIDLMEDLEGRAA
ncbi:MAG: hypothetical protein ABSE62_04910 [Chthoniobacteraceae bacterium]